MPKRARFVVGCVVLQCLKIQCFDSTSDNEKSFNLEKSVRIIKRTALMKAEGDDLEAFSNFAAVLNVFFYSVFDIEDLEMYFIPH